jgi:hypothetical protein
MNERNGDLRVAVLFSQGEFDVILSAPCRPEIRTNRWRRSR